MGKISAEQFLQAAESGQLVTVQSYIRKHKKHLDTARSDQFHLPAIALASLNGHANIVKELITAGADVNARIGKGATALFTAVWSGHLDIVRLLINTNDIDLNATVANGDTPLSIAARLGHLEMVQSLLAAGANIQDYEKLVARTQMMGRPDITQVLKKYSSQQSNPTVDAPKKQNSKRSRDVFEDLDKRNLIGHYADWSDKTSGVMTGATLYGVNKFGQQKKVYVKSYRDGGYGGGGSFDELIDYAGFYILKKCGARAPKAKLKGNSAKDNSNLSEKIFIFSTDLGQGNLEHATKRYRFFEQSHYPQGSEIWNGVLKSKSDLFPEVESTVSEDLDKDYYEYPLDAASAVRLSFLTSILNLSDLHSGNTGLVVSNDQGKTKTKFGVIDFCNQNSYVSAIKADSLPAFIATYGSCLPHEFRLKAKESDYIAAFAKIEANFLNACNEVKANVHAMPFISKDRKHAFNRTIKLWKSRYETVSSLVSAARDNTHHEPSKPARK